jgi:ribosome biogenesis GTPase
MTGAGAASGEGDAPLVLRVAGPSATLQVRGETVEAPLLPRLPGGPPVVGDRVEVREGEGSLVVSGVLPRRTSLDRSIGATGVVRTVVANADLLLVVAAIVDPPLRPRLLDRYLVAAWAGGLDAAIVLTKADLAEDAREAEVVAARYRDIGYPVLVGNAKDPALLTAVTDLIGTRVAALAGHSGVGKSTLTRGLTGVARATGSVSAKNLKGRHTTSDPRLVPLPSGGAVVDTAGVRTFFIPPLEADELAHAFPEIAAAASACRFRGCSHSGDAGCAVADRVTPERLDSYRRLLDGISAG